MKLLSLEDWTERAKTHSELVRPAADAFLQRRALGQKHPVYDFLFTYYNFSPTKLKHWVPSFEESLTFEENGELTYFSDYRFLRQNNTLRLNPERLQEQTLSLVTFPELRNYERIELLEIAHQILTKANVSPQKAKGYSKEMGLLYDKVTKAEPSYIEAEVKGALNFFFYALTQEPSKCTLEGKKNSLINVATSVRHCLAGSYVRLTEETKRVAGQEEKTRDLLLAIVEEWKNDTLTAIFGTSSQSVHGFAAFQVKFGRKYGLDVEAGLRDRNREACGNFQLTPEREALFEERCNNAEGMVEEIKRRINEKVDNYGSVMNLSLYEADVRTWLEEMGCDEALQEQKIDSFFSTVEDYRLEISEEGVKFLLTQIGLLNS